MTESSSWWPPPRRHELNLFVAVLAVILLTTVLDSSHNYVYKPGINATNIVRSTSLLGIFALGAAIVIVSGGIDLSSGSVIAFSGTICCTVMLVLDPEGMTTTDADVAGWALAVAVGTSILCGVLIGSLHAWLITSIGLPPFVATLATLVGLRSLARAICKSVTEVSIGRSKSQIDINDEAFLEWTRSVPFQAIVFVALAILCWLVMSLTVTGRHLYALGGNEEAARLSGIRTDRMKWLAYCASAVLSSIAGILIVGNNGTAVPESDAIGYELFAIAAAVVGGCSLQGGIGTIPGTVLGALFLRTIIDGVSKVIKTESKVYEGLIVGMVVVCAVAFSQSRPAGVRRLFSGWLGWVTIGNLSLLAGVMAALIGPKLFEIPESVGAIWIAFGVSLATLTVLVSLQLYQSRR